MANFAGHMNCSMGPGCIAYPASTPANWHPFQQPHLALGRGVARRADQRPGMVGGRAVDQVFEVLRGWRER